MKKEWFDRIVSDGKKLQLTITPQDMYNELYDICDREHFECNVRCPVFAKCLEDGEFEKNKATNCPYSRNGSLMFERLMFK
jgi:hypothetical protein